MSPETIAKEANKQRLPKKTKIQVKSSINEPIVISDDDSDEIMVKDEAIRGRGGKILKDKKEPTIASASTSSVPLWLHVAMYPGQPKLLVAIKAKSTLPQAITQVRHELRLRGIGEGWTELLGLESLANPGTVWSRDMWATVMRQGGDRDVELVWE